MNLLNQGFDHVEFVVDDLNAQRALYERMGFVQTGSRKLPHRGTESILMAQGYVRILLTKGDGSPQSEKDEAVIFRKKHAEGVCVLALEVEDAALAYQEVMARGARSAAAPEVFETAEGRVVRAEIWTPADVRYRFISRKSPKGENSPALFEEGLVVSTLKAPSPNGIYRIDHLTNNVGMGEMKDWVAYYQKIFGFHVSRHFDIQTGRTGLTSDVVESPCRRVKVPINEATEAQSQVQEFVNRMKGPGVQHLALETTGLIDTLKALRTQSFHFLTVPHTYYEVVPTRVPGVTENLQELEELGILLDGEGEGYLLQIFSQEILGPFFFEYIQRKGNQGFGEGNFRALFEAIERDQIRRGVLEA
jgi:4-hydroxyphenylpyruvate dioxygenase